jgi:hypothetical protein
MGLQRLWSTILCATLWLTIGLSAGAQEVIGQAPISAPITLTENAAPVLMAQAPQRAESFNPTVLPTDVTPISRGAQRALLSRELRFSLMKRLPTRLWFSLNTEVSQRYESNVFFTYSHHRGDYVFRALPNVTVGYNLLPHTSVYCNYFAIKDVFAKHQRLSFPTTQSLSMGVRHDLTIGRKTSVQFDFQARELWQASHLHQFDFLPSVNVTYVARPRTYLFGSLLLQMRGREYFAAPTRELDPFYTIGGIYQRGAWTFLATDTFVTNFRSPPFRGSIPRQGNATMIADFEVSHPVVRKIPGLVAFVRVEPVWNWSSHKQTGLSGFDIRVFGGLRLAVNKQSYLSSIERLRQQLIESEQVQPRRQPKKDPKSSANPPAVSPDSGSNIRPTRSSNLLNISPASSPARPAISERKQGRYNEPITMLIRQPPSSLSAEEALKSAVNGRSSTISVPQALF